jgi:hypothetical protein
VFLPFATVGKSTLYETVKAKQFLLTSGEVSDRKVLPMLERNR